MAKKTATANTVTVYCALPNGLAFPLPDGRQLLCNGVNTPRGADRVLTAGRYGLTPGVPAEDWKWVKKTYGEAAYFKAEPPLLYAEDDPREGDARAREASGDVQTGMEQVDVHAENAAQTEPEAR